MSETDALFHQASAGDRDALDTVFTVVYPTLRKIARGYLVAEARNLTPQPTALVNEADLALVNLRYFAGLSIEEAASVLDISPATAKRDWTVARLWLLHELAD